MAGQGCSTRNSAMKAKKRRFIDGVLTAVVVVPTRKPLEQVIRASPTRPSSAFTRRKIITCWYSEEQRRSGDEGNRARRRLNGRRRKEEVRQEPTTATYQSIRRIDVAATRWGGHQRLHGVDADHLQHRVDLCGRSGAEVCAHRGGAVKRRSRSPRDRPGRTRCQCQAWTKQGDWRRPRSV